MPSPWHLLAGFTSSLLLCLLLTAWLAERAPRLGLLDHPGGRKTHSHPVPTVGGIAIFGAITVSFLLLASWPPDALGQAPDRLPFYVILTGGAVVLVLGIADDRWGLAARTKLLVQIVIGLGAFAGGIRLTAVQLPGLGLVEFAPALSVLFTVVWLVGVTNAFNLVDGADGLAGGAGLAATLSLFIVALVFGHPLAALLLATAGGALLAFLRSNFPPASVYMGDAGSLLIGFLLASLGLVSTTKAATVVAIAIPVLALGLPVLDTTLATGRRFIAGRSVMSPDRGHIHHHLMDRGHSPRTVALILTGASALFGLASMLLAVENARLTALVFIIIGGTVGWGIHRLRIPELLELRGAFDRGLGQRRVISRNLEIRTGTNRVSTASSIPAVFDELSAALGKADFDHGEMWLAGDFLTPGLAAEHAGFDRVDDGSIWRWAAGPAEPDQLTRYWEVKLPVIDSLGAQVGRLTLRRPMSPEMPSDLLLLARDLLPGIVAAIQRLQLTASEAAHAPDLAPGTEFVPEPEIAPEPPAAPKPATGPAPRAPITATSDSRVA